MELEQMSTRIARVLTQEDRIREIASAVVDRENWLFLGRGLHWPVAMEGALKLKEISYIHAEGMPAAEMKHGPIALIDDGMPVVFVATPGAQYEKVLANIEEVRARGGRVIAIVEEGDTHAASLAEHVLEVPAAPEALQPLLTVVPLQLLAYHAAVFAEKMSTSQKSGQERDGGVTHSLHPLEEALLGWKHVELHVVERLLANFTH